MVQVSQALNPRRISRALVTILGLTLVQTVLPPVLAPQLSTPTANAITNTYSPAQATEWLVPANVTQISVTIKGGSGGVGGQDCGAGCNNQAGGPRGSFSYTFTVTPGDVIGIYPGYKGANGLNSTNSGGGAAGADTSPNGTFDGGSGGGAGSGGFSGAGGGGGAASVLLINSVLRAVAGGAGGGGGAANVAGSGRVGSEYSSGSLNGASFTGGAGGTTSACTTTSGGSTNDGGGSGGSGGGYYGGAAMPVYAASAGECAGNGGMRGGNYIFTNDGTAVIGNSGVAQGSETVANTDGSIVIDYTPASISACTETAQTVDIYRVIKLSATGSCTWTIPAGVTTIDLFAVGGGGAGGSFGGSGGGGGAAISRTALPVTAATNLTVKIGYGGGASFTDGWSGGNGDSTTISFPSGLFLAANGGSMGVKGDGTNSKVGGLGGTAVNGGFAGGAGGVSATTVNTRGAVGKTGVSNYFSGIVAEYGGGGGGGTHKNTCTPLDGQLGSSGGAAGASCNSNVNSAGGSALAETGGGGGGGGYGTSGNTLGGRGGSGVILIRYATEAANSFPSIVSSALSSRYVPGDLQLLDSTRKGWIDSSGTNASVANSAIAGSTTSITTRGTTDGVNLTDSTKTNLVAKGGTADRITLNNLPANYTLFSVARYVTGGTNGRLITANGGDWFSGFYNGMNGCAHPGTWLTGSGCNTTNLYGWQINTDQLKYFRQNGNDVTMNQDANNGGGFYYLYNQSTSTGFGINNDPYNQNSTWEVADVLIFNRQLSSGEIRAVETYLSRIYGIALSSTFQSSETDTAVSFNNSSHFYGQFLNGMYINDTFTMQTWVNPNSFCNTGTCALFNYESVLVTKIENGEFQYALWGVNSTWDWINTGVKIPSGEWHHIALTKRLRYGQANAVDLYLDGQLAWTRTGNPYTNAAPNTTTTDIVNTNDTWWYLGARSGSTRFYGLVDEFKLWKVARTGAEIATDMHSNDASSPNLQLYFDFNRNSLTNQFDLQNLAMGGASRSDMVAATSITYVDVKTVTSSGPYTTVSFPRSYITQSGGWKVPNGIETATTIVVGGGGGGGFGGSTNAPAGAGGGGGVTASLTQSFTPGATIGVKVGAGGIGGYDTRTASVRNGQSSSLGVGATLTALGGGGGGNHTRAAGADGSSIATGGGSGGGSDSCVGAQAPYSLSGSIVAGGTVSSGYNGSGGVWGWGGSGGGARGAAQNGDCNGNQSGTPGPGFFDPVTNIEYGRGGNAASFTTTNAITGYKTQNNGWGGVISYNGGNATGIGYRGSAGTVVVRYITASKPTYTKPSNAYLNVGMTETFTTNVAQESATAVLTRTFKWESSTAGAGGPFTTIKQGTGPSNAVFSWVPTDTSTSGNQYLYRLTVTDSDTAGLFITDSSTAFAVINGTLQMTGVNTIKKQINVARSETFTISSGTPGYRYTLSPVIPGITLDTSTVGTTFLRISDTASVGTYLETLTVTDSVSASVAIPISITISAPPSLVNYSEIETNDLVFNIDISNSASYSRAAGTISDISGTKKPVTIVGGSTFSEDYSGTLKLSSSQYISATGFSTLSSFTIEAYINLQSISSSQVCIFGAEQSPTNVPYFLCIDTSRTVFTGFYNGVWTYKRTSQTLTLGAWTHVVGVFDSTTAGAKVELYINGVATTLSDSSQNATLVPPASSTDRVFINKWFYTSTAPSSAMDIGFIRLYRAPLGQAKVVQNYNATKDRFAVSNINQLKLSQKYGTLNLESFTVTSGGDTKTVSFAVGNRTGITWDTSTVAGRISLSVQESLTPGNYYDTITVTDNFGQSTSLPITFTVSKADTITVIAGAATSQVYNTSPATAIPNFTISGLVSSDTGTVLRKYTGVDWTKPCAQGGGCEVGDTGPGGGTIFYISPTAINAATGISAGGKYLEVAPLNWSGLSVESTTAWAKAITSVTGTLATLGSGAENTRLINNALTTNSVAAKVAADLVLNGKSDWFLPSTLEVKEMYDALYAPGLAGNLSVANYWSSTQGSTTSQADTYWFGSGGLVSPTNKLQSYTLRPIRAYSPDTITVTTVPTNVDSYTVTVDTPTLTVGSLAHYEGVIYQRSGVDITKARQNPLTVSSYVANFGSPYTLTLLGGSGTGAVTESLTAGSTATGCTLNGRVITTTTAGTCVLQMKKAYSRNYFAETGTATLYLLVWAINQPTNQSGGGATIGLNGPTSIIRDPNVAPTISSVVTQVSCLGNSCTTSWSIYGAGFGNAYNTATVVKFWRNKILVLGGVNSDNYIVNDGFIYIGVPPAGATTGKILVTTANGSAVSPENWIAP